MTVDSVNTSHSQSDVHRRPADAMGKADVQLESRKGPGAKESGRDGETDTVEATGSGKTVQ